MSAATSSRPPRAAFALVTASLLLGGCGGSAPPAAVFGPASVAAVKAEAVDVPLFVEEIGRAVATEVVSVRPRVSGQVVAATVTDGQDVEAGAPLFEIDPRPYAAALAQAEAREGVARAAAEETRTAVATAASRVGSAKSRLAEAKAKVDATRAGVDEAAADVDAADAEAARAQDDLARFERVASGAVSEQEVERARTTLRAARARAAASRTRRAATEAEVREVEASVATAEDGVREAESLATEAAARVTSAQAEVARAVAAVTAAKLDREFCAVRAPIGGRVGRRLVDVGNVVGAGVDVLLTIQRMDPVYAEFSVTEDELTRVQASLGSKPVTVEVRLPEDTGEPRSGPLTFIDNTVDPATGTVRARATLSNADRRFWPGRFVRVRVILETLEGAILVPASAPVITAQGTVVLVVTPEGTAQIRPVVLGQRHGDRFVITSGIAAGDLVIVAGQLGAMSGAPVKVEAPPAAAPPAPAQAKSGS